MHMESSAGHAAAFRTPPQIHPSEREGDEANIPGQLSALGAENRELRAEIERLRGERNRLNETQTRMMELLGTKSPERLLHDLRNVLNERELYRALADASM
jgi:hypothetical protein